LKTLVNITVKRRILHHAVTVFGDVMWEISFDEIFVIREHAREALTLRRLACFEVRALRLNEVTQLVAVRLEFLQKRID
jgi:hypothetical protein